MVLNKEIVLIHGTWCDGNVWGEFATGLRQMGYKVHTPSFRYHDLPYQECLAKVGTVTLQDYRDDLVTLIESLDQPPLILGHSLGCLVAQMVAEKTEVAGMILMGPAPTADIFAFYPTRLACFGKHFLRWGFWKKAMPPYKKEFFKYCMNEQEESLKEEVFADLVSESGKVYTQMALHWFDKTKAAYVDFSQISCPVLVISGTKDKMTHPNIARRTAKNYRDSVLVSLTGADHMYESGKFQQKTLKVIKGWSQQNGFVD